MHDNFAQLAGIELLEVREGYAKARLKVEEKHLNGYGVCMGGALFTLADHTCAAAANSHGTLTVSVAANITFLKSAMPGYIYAEAVETANHHVLPYIEVKITDEEGTLLAVMTSSCYRKNGVKADSFT